MKRDFLTVITPTGDRPEAFALCWSYMARQTRLPDKWIIVDDGKTPMFPVPEPFPSIKGVSIHYIIRARSPNEPAHTLPVQLDHALKFVSEIGPILIMEDDDWYCSHYCRHMENAFCQFPGMPLIGQAPAIYYHVGARKIFWLRNQDHASLCQTGFHSSLVPEVRKICQRMCTSQRPFVDLELWKLPVSRFLFPQNQSLRLCVGIKGMPGRTSNATIGHRADHPRYQPDPDLVQLRELIGDDVNNYAKYYQPPADAPSGGDRRS